MGSPSSAIVKLFEFHNQITLTDGSVMRAGSVEGGPQVVGSMLYWGVGAETAGLFANKNGIFTNAGSRIFGFELASPETAIPAADE